MKMLLLRSLAGIGTVLACSQAVAGGRIVVSHDVNTLSSNRATMNEAAFAANVARWITGKESGTILAVESEPTDAERNYSQLVRTALASAGFEVTYTTSTSFTLSQLLSYDGVFHGVAFIAQSAIDSSALIDFVNAGRGVYVYSGTGPNIAIEGSLLNPFINAFGLAYDTVGYNNLLNSGTITSTHPIFVGIAPSLSLSCGRGANIFDLQPGNPANQIVHSLGDNNLYAVFEGSACPADLTGDGQVDDSDFVLFAAAYNTLDCADPAMPAGCPADLNNDALVDDGDFVLFAAAYNDLLCP